MARRPRTPLITRIVIINNNSSPVLLALLAHFFTAFSFFACVRSVLFAGRYPHVSSPPCSNSILLSPMTVLVCWLVLAVVLSWQCGPRSCTSNQAARGGREARKNKTSRTRRGIWVNYIAITHHH